MKFKKLSAILLTATIAVGLLSGCGNKNNSNFSQSTKSKENEITLMIPDWGAPSEEMLKEFKDETGIKVNLQKTGWDDIKKKVSVASTGKNAPADVFEVDWSWVGEFQSAGWLEKLDVPEDVQKDMPSLAYFKINDGIYAVPYSNDMRLAYMNQEMMKKAGLTENPKNWKELESSFAKMKDAKSVEYPLLFPLTAEEKTTTSFMTLAYTRNGIVFNDDGTLNKESTLDALKLIETMLKKGYLDPNSVSTPGMDVFKGIQNGNGAFLEGPTSYVTSVNDKKESKVVGQVKAIPFPGKDGIATKSISFTEAIGISPFSKNKEAAKKFVEWFYKPETQVKLNKAVYIMPTRISVLEKMIKDKEIDAPEFVIEQSKKVESPFPHGVPKYYTKMSTEMFNVINQLGQGKLTAEEATDQMIQRVDQIVKDNSK